MRKSTEDSKIKKDELTSHANTELTDEELEKVSGGVMPRIRRGSRGLFTIDAGDSELMTDASTMELFTMDGSTDE